MKVLVITHVEELSEPPIPPQPAMGIAFAEIDAASLQARHVKRIPRAVMEMLQPLLEEELEPSAPAAPVEG